MKKRILKNTDIELSPIAVGCMRLTGLSEYEAEKFIVNALESGINFFDHADIYDGGKCELLFGKILKSALYNAGLKREDIILQTKCGIIPGKMYDLSKKHIIESVNQSLKRLNVDYIDVLLLHRPDALVEPEEVAAAFDNLESDGKVRYFGVSNHNSMQIELLEKYLKKPVCFNQLQIGPAHTSMITSGLEVNMETDGALNRDGSILDYCRLNNITIQAWSPFQYGFIEGPFFTAPEFANLTKVLEKIGEKYNVSATAIAAAWLLRHPCNMQVISGTMNINHFNEICKAAWFALEIF